MQYQYYIIHNRRFQYHRKGRWKIKTIIISVQAHFQKAVSMVQQCRPRRLGADMRAPFSDVQLSVLTVRRDPSVLLFASSLSKSSEPLPRFDAVYWPWNYWGKDKFDKKKTSNKLFNLNCRMRSFSFSFTAECTSWSWRICSRTIRFRNKVSLRLRSRYLRQTSTP